MSVGDVLGLKNIPVKDEYDWMMPGMEALCDIDEFNPYKVVLNSHYYTRDGVPVVDLVGGDFMYCFFIHRLPDCVISELREILKPAIEGARSRQAKLPFEVDSLVVKEIDAALLEAAGVLELNHE